jgi:hypothetical protein
MRSAFCAFAVFLMLTSVARSGEIAVPAGVEVVAAPDLKVGSWWELKTADGKIRRLELVRVDGDALIIRDQDGVELPYTRSLNAEKSVAPSTGAITNWSPDWGRYFFPLWVGKSSSVVVHAVSMTSQGAVSWTFTSKSDVEKVEEIATPAGKFSAYKIVNYSDDDPWITCWYAPAVRWPIKCVGARTPIDSTLVAYHLE